MKYTSILLTIIWVAISLQLSGQEKDSLDYKVIYSWELNSVTLNQDFVSVDTSLNLFQNYNSILKNKEIVNYLGNLATPAQYITFIKRQKNKTDFIFSKPYAVYYHNPQNQKYYNTKRHYSLLNYTNVGPKIVSEQTLSVFHSQNVNKKLNVGVDYDMVSSEGRYLNQKARQNNVTFFSNYIGKQYSVHGNFTLNRFASQENGGIDSLHYLGLDKYENRRNIPVKLEDASSKYYSTSLFLVNKYSFGKKVREMVVTEKKAKKKRTKRKIENQNLGNTIAAKTDSTYMDTTYNEHVELTRFSVAHKLYYNRGVRKYYDENLVDSFYNDKNIYINPARTHDRVDQRLFQNSLLLIYQATNNITCQFAINNQQIQYRYWRPQHAITETKLDTIISKEELSNTANTSVSSSFMGEYSKLKFVLSGQYYFSGYKKKSSDLNFTIKYNLNKNNQISLNTYYNNATPDFWHNNYASNHFMWKNRDFKMQENRDIAVGYENKITKTQIDITYSQLTNYIYFNKQALPDQFQKQINITTANIIQNIKLGPVNSHTCFTYQTSTNDSILSIPEFSVYQSLYFQHLLKFKSTKGWLLFQIGVDYRYNSKFFADAYMPLTGVFYRQNQIQQENVHRFDAFINFGIKRANFFLRYDYLNSAIKEKYYFSTPYYPVPQPAFKFGLSWAFYN